MSRRDGVTAEAGKPVTLGNRISAKGIVEAALNLLRVVAILVAAMGLLIMRSPTSPLQFGMAFALCALATIAAIGIGRRSAWAVSYLVAFAAFAYLRALADDTGMPVQYEYAIQMEALLPGELPNVWLQRHLWSPETSLLDVAMVAVYVSYFVVPHALAFLIWKKRPSHVRRYAVAIIIALYAATVFAALVPTAPPWLAAEEARIGEVHKVSDWVYGRISVDGYTSDIERMNPVSAMPSLHFSLTVITLFGLWQFGNAARAAGLAYVGVMGFALVYLGEHYVVDMAGGAALAWCSWVLAEPAYAWVSELTGRKRRKVASGEATSLG